MKSKRALAVFLLSCSTGQPAISGTGLGSYQENPYAVRTIDPSFRGKASAVVRRKEIQFDARFDGSGTIRIVRAVTVFREAGKTWGEFSVSYDGLDKLEEFEGMLLNADGEEIKELEEEDITDVGDWSSTELTTDVRVRHGSLMHNVYPYTVVFSVEIEQEAGINWPEWSARESYDPVEYTRFEVRHPASKPLRYSANRDTLSPTRWADGSDSVYAWEARMVPALPDDGSFDDLESVSPRVMIAPYEFDVEGHSGSMKTWGGFGSWFSSLCRDRSALPQEAVLEMKRLTDSIPDWKQRARTVYQYLQDRTRYISIQLGIGGWQPFDASFVHSRRYGDCKALSNYMVALLKAADVTAYPVLIRSGQYVRPTDESFPSNQFNHVVVCLPNQQDTVWLECTSQTRPFGRLGVETEGRAALLIDDTGGRIVYTPVTGPAENRQIRSASAKLDRTGRLIVSLRTEQRGNQQNYIRSVWANASPERRQKEFLNEHGIPDAVVTSLTARGVAERSEEAVVQVEAEFPTYASRSSDRLFVPLNPFERNARPPAKVKKRLGPKKLHFGYTDVDSILIKLPSGYEIEALPGGNSITSFFGSYERSVTVVSRGTLLLKRKILIQPTLIPVDAYGEYAAFMTERAKADRAQVVLRKQ